MVTVADASIAIRGDLTGFRTDLRGAEKETRTLGGRLRDALSPRNIAAGAGLFGIGLGVRQLVGFAGDAVKAYGELEQTVKTVDDVFGNSAGVIHEWGATAADTAGMSQQTFMSSAAVMGTTLQNMGFTIQESAEKSAELLGRAADLAIAFGKRPADALLAITAAMRGERDTIEKFGIAIKQVDVNARISALGLDTSTAAAKKNAEAIAVVDLVLEQSADTAGRFADSQDDIAVKMAQMNAKWDDFIAKDVGHAVADGLLFGFTAIQNIGEEVDMLSMHFGDSFQAVLKIAHEQGISWDEAQQKIILRMIETGDTFEEVSEGMTRDAMLAGAAIAMELPKGVQEAARLTALGGPVVAEAWDKVEAAQQSELDQMVKAAKQAGKDAVVGFGDSILDNRQVAFDAIADVVAGFEDEITAAELIAEATGEDAIQGFKDGLASDDAGIRLATQGRLSIVISELNALGPAGARAAAALMASLAAGLEDVTAGARLRTAALNAAGIATAPFPRSEPKDPLSPFRGITHWGGNIVRMIADDMTANLTPAQLAGRALAGALVPSFASSAVGMAATSGVAGGTAGVGNTYVTVPVQGLVYGRNADEIGSAVKRYATSGKLVRERRIVNR